MISRNTLQKTLYFDVETASYYENYETLREENPRMADLWIRRCEYYRNSSPLLSDLTEGEIYKLKASLEAEFARAVCVSFCSFSDTGEKKMMSFYGVDETDILTKTNKILNNALSAGFKICGHNIKGFDVPFLGRRMIYNGIQPSRMIQVSDKKPWEVPFLDTLEIFSFGNWASQRSLSLDLLTACLNVDSPKDDISGKEVSERFWAGDYERIKEYCEKDVISTVLVLEKICFEY